MSGQGFAGWHDVEIFAIPSRRWSEVYGLVTSWWEQMEPSRLLLFLFLLAFTKYWKAVVRGSAHGEAHIWCIARSELLVFVGMALVVAVHDGIVPSKTADPRVLFSACAVLTSLLSRISSHLENFKLFKLICGTSFDGVLLYLSVGRLQEVDLSIIDLEDCFSPYRWNYAEVVNLPDGLVPERQCSADGRFVYHNYRSTAIKISYR